MQPVTEAEIEIRRKAVEELKNKPPDTAIPELLRAMEDRSWRIRKLASEILIENFQIQGYINGLIQLLYIDDNAGARNSAIELLIRLGKKATPYLITAFNTDNRDVRKFIIDIFGETRDRRVIPLLLKALRDEDENVRASAVEHLGHMGETEVVDALIEILNSGDIWTAFPAADALGRIGDRKAIPHLLKALSIKALREPVIGALGRLADPVTLEHVVPFILEKSRTIQEVAVKTVEVFYHNGVSADLISGQLQRYGKEMTERLLSMAWSKREEIRASAIMLLGLMKDESTLLPLLDLSTDERFSEDVKRAFLFIGKHNPYSLVSLIDTNNIQKRRFVIEILSEIASSEYYDLLKRLIMDRDGHIRALAAIGLSRIGRPDAIELIFPLLSDPFEDVQEAAVSALCLFKNDIDINRLTGLLSDKNPRLRKNAAILIGKIGATEAVNSLGFALKDEDVSVRYAVTEALSALGAEANRYLLNALTDECPGIRATAALGLASNAGKEAVEPLVLLLNDSDDSVRVAAAKALGITGDAGAVPFLINALFDRNGFVVTTAMMALGRIGGKDARESLIRMMNSDDMEIRRTAIRALSSFDDIEDVILPCLMDQDWATRLAALEVLCKRLNPLILPHIERLYDTEEDPVVRKAIKECLTEKARFT